MLVSTVISQGAPMSNLLTWNHATVTVCHSKTKDLPDVVCIHESRIILSTSRQSVQIHSVITGS